MVNNAATITLDYNGINGRAYICLKNASNKLKKDYAKAVMEVVSNPIDARYLIKNPGILGRKYIAVPSIFAARKETAEIFLTKFKNTKYLSFNKNKIGLIYTKNAEGKSALFESRLEAISSNKKEVSMLMEIYPM